MVTPKSVVETTPLVVARIKQLEHAQRFRRRTSAAAAPQRREPHRSTRLVSAP